MSKPLLYSFCLSSCSWRVRMALNLKKIEYDLRTVNLLDKEQHTEEYKQINPSMNVPALIHNGNVLTQSQSILEYLEATFPKSIPLLSKNDPVKQAHVRSICQIIVADTQPLQNMKVMKFLGGEHRDRLTTWAIQNGFEAFEKMLEKYSGKYCCGDELSMADVCLVPQVYNAYTRSNVDVKQFHHISRIYETLAQLEEVHESHPMQQPDFTEKLRDALLKSVSSK